MITTFLHDGELNQKLSSQELADVLADARKVTGQDWQVVERTQRWTERKWFFKKVPRTSRKYEIYIYVGGMGPWQAINFYDESPVSPNLTSINFTVSVDVAVAFFYGVLAGAHYIGVKNDQR
jgi:hypothetical protein